MNCVKLVQLDRLLCPLKRCLSVFFFRFIFSREFKSQTVVKVGTEKAACPSHFLGLTLGLCPVRCGLTRRCARPSRLCLVRWNGTLCMAHLSILTTKTGSLNGSTHHFCSICTGPLLKGLWAEAAVEKYTSRHLCSPRHLVLFHLFSTFLCFKNTFSHLCVTRVHGVCPGSS